jgi:hypothetical protein
MLVSTRCSSKIELTHEETEVLFLALGQALSANDSIQYLDSGLTVDVGRVHYSLSQYDLLYSLFSSLPGLPL